MFSGVVGQTFRAGFSVDDGTGRPRTGLTSGEFTATVVVLDDTDSVVVTVSESSQLSGLYFLDVPGSFLTTNGAGEYCVLIDISADDGLEGLRTLQLQVTEADIEQIALDAADTRKTLGNREEIDFAAQELISYEDDGTTPRKRWPVETDGGEAVTTNTGVLTKRKPSVI